MKTIAVIDDDVYIGNVVEEVLRCEGYSVLRAYSGTEALYLLSNSKPDLILLDLMLPGLSGEEVLPRVQGIPVIVISAKADIDSKVSLLLSGAADYLTKPFDTKELLARIAVQLRQCSGQTQTAVITVGPLLLDGRSHGVTCNGNPVKLTKTEFAILKLLMVNAGHAISKSSILDSIAADTPDCTEDSLKQHISNLRVKLREADEKDMIEAVWGIGYKLITE